MTLRGNIYSIYVRSAMLHAAECWAPRQTELVRLARNERAMLRWMCGVRTGERIGTSTLLKKLNLPNLGSALRNRRLRWLGHVLRSDGWIKEITKLQVEGQAARGGTRKNWHGQIEKDLELVGLTKEDAQHREVWRARLRGDMLNEPSNRSTGRMRGGDVWNLRLRSGRRTGADALMT